jgi:hypothetical protein
MQSSRAANVRTDGNPILRYRLRTLLIVVAAISLLLGYWAHYRRRQHDFVRNQQAIFSLHPPRNVLANKTDLSAWAMPRPADFFQARRSRFRWCELNPYISVAVAIPKEDVIVSTVEGFKGRAVQREVFWIPDSQSDCLAAKRLFQGAAVFAFVRTADGWIQVAIGDSE